MRQPLVRDRNKPKPIKVVAVAHRQLKAFKDVYDDLSSLWAIDDAFNTALTHRKNYTAGLYTKAALEQAENEQLVEEIITLE